MPPTALGSSRSLPTTDVDLFSHDLAQDPFGIYRDLRDRAAAVYVEQHNFWVLTRYDDVRSAAADWETFSSSHGVALLDRFNAGMRGTILASDPPEHDVLRGVLADQLAPRALRGLQATIRDKVSEIVDAALRRDHFDAAPDLAWQIPVRVVADLLGLSEEGRDLLLPGADAAFTTFGPDSPTLQRRMAAFESHMRLVQGYGDGSRLAPGSWGAAISDAAAAGKIDGQQANRLLRAFLVAGMDTTANALTALIQIMATDAGLWEDLREDPSRAASVFEETMRLQSPVQGIFRFTTRDVELDGVVVPAGERVMLHFGAANRDERKYDEPDTFVAERNPIDHLGFGYGTHACAGQGLARIEARALAEVLVERVEHIEVVGPAVRHENPIIRGLESLPVSVRLR